MRGLAIFIAPLVLGCAQVFGAAYWAGSGGAVDETVADALSEVASFKAAAASSDELAKAEFRYPHVDELENVSFIVERPRSVHGIYRSYGINRRLSELVASGSTALPDGSVASYISGLQTSGLDFVFNASSKTGYGFYYWHDGALRTIAGPGTTVGGESITLAAYGCLADDRVLFTAQTANSYLLAQGPLEGGEPRVLVHSGMPIPGRPGESFQFIALQNWMRGDDLVFRAARAMSPYQADDEAEKKDGKNAAGVRGLYGWFGNSPIDPDSYAMKNLRTIADWTTPVPGLPGRKFTQMHSAPVDKGLVPFVGGVADCEGIYLYDACAKQDRRLRVIADGETKMPGLFAGTFDSFGHYPAVFDGCVAFTATSTDGFAGVFLYNAGTDTLFRLADNRAPIAGKKVTGFEIAGHFLVRNRFAIAVTFEDQSSGVYLATIPVEGFTRMGAPGL